MKTVLDDILELDNKELIELVKQYENKNKLSEKLPDFLKQKANVQLIQQSVALAMLLINRPEKNIYQIISLTKNCNPNLFKILVKYFDYGIDYDRKQEGLNKFGIYREYIQKTKNFEELKQLQAQVKELLKNKPNLTPVINNNVIDKIKKYSSQNKELCFDITNWGKETNTFSVSDFCNNKLNNKNLMVSLKNSLSFALFTASNAKNIDGAKQIIDPLTNEVIFENKYLSEQNNLSYEELIYCIFGKKALETLYENNQRALETKGDIVWKKKLFQYQHQNEK